MDPNAPTAWNLYIGTDDIEALAKRVTDAGGTVDGGAVRRRRPGTDGGVPGPVRRLHLGLAGDPHGRLPDRAPNSFGWAELNARGIDKAMPFYSRLRLDDQDEPDGRGPARLQRVPDRRRERRRRLGDEPEVPAEVPSYWQVYFAVDDVDAAFKKAIELGAHGDPRSAGLPRRPVRDRERPAGRELRPAEDDASLTSSRLRQRPPRVRPRRGARHLRLRTDRRHARRPREVLAGRAISARRACGAGSCASTRTATRLETPEGDVIPLEARVPSRSR